MTIGQDFLDIVEERSSNTDTQVGSDFLQEVEGTKEPQGFLAKTKDLFTGESRMNPEMESLSTIGELPELNQMSIAGLKSAFVSMTSDPKETVQALQANFPDLEARQDEKGNWIVKSPTDQKEYAVNVPGLDARDIVRGALTAAMFIPTGKVAGVLPRIAAAAGIQGAIETGQELAGGEFDAEQVPLAGAVEAIAPGVSKGISLGKSAIKKPKPLVGKIIEKIKPQKLVESSSDLDLAEMGKIAKKASLETGKRQEKTIGELATKLTPDEPTIASAKRLKIDEYLEPDHISSDRAFKELSQAVKSVPGGKAREVEKINLSKIKKGIEESLEELGSVDDLSIVDEKVKTKISKTIVNLENEANLQYKNLKKLVPSDTQVSATNVINFIEKRIKELGGARNLSSIEKMVYSKLKPKTKVVTKSGSKLLDQFGKPIQESISQKKEIYPLYGLLDDIRKDLTSAKYKRQGPFKDAQTGIIKKLESELMKDQKKIIDDLGFSEMFNKARALVRTRKGLEDDMTALFGKNLKGSIITPLTKGVKDLQKQNTRSFINFIKHIPKDMRQEVTASGLATAFGKSARSGELSFKNYANWYKNLKRNKQAYGALIVNLPPRARNRLQDFYTVSDAISKTSEGYIATGRLQAAKEVMKGSENLISNVYSGLMKSLKPALAAEAVTSSVGLPGGGTIGVLASTFRQGNPDIMKLADDLISSDEFINSMRKLGGINEKEAIRKLAKTTIFKKFYNNLSDKIKDKSAERWISNILQSYRQTTEEKEQ